MTAVFRHRTAVLFVYGRYVGSRQTYRPLLRTATLWPVGYRRMGRKVSEVFQAAPARPSDKHVF